MEFEPGVYITKLGFHSTQLNSASLGKRMISPGNMIAALVILDFFNSFHGGVHNEGTSKSSIYRLGFSRLNHPAIGATPIYGHPHIVEHDIPEEHLLLVGGEYQFVSPASGQGTSYWPSPFSVLRGLGLHHFSAVRKKTWLMITADLPFTMLAACIWYIHISSESSQSMSCDPHELW